MTFPEIKYSDGIVTAGQTAFGGLNHTLGAGDGEIYDMENLTSDHCPVLSVRDRRYRVGSLDAPKGIYFHDALVTVGGGTVKYGGEVIAQNVTADCICSLGRRIIIMPDKLCYDARTGTLTHLEAQAQCGSLVFSDGTVYAAEAEANTVQCPGIIWTEYFKAGDAVEISGCTAVPANNKTAVIREIDGDKLRFSENCFTLPTQHTAVTETGALSVKRSVPELEYMCENENRLWGCAGDTIYACKPGDPENWNVFDGIASDAWAAQVGSPGEFTGAAAYLGYPMFFKENRIYKIYGSIPSNFQLVGSAVTGVERGSAKSIVIAGETLYYKSCRGVMSYTGSVPRLISQPLGTGRYREAAAGSDGGKYYISMKNENSAWELFVYDTELGLWHKEDNTHAVGFAGGSGRLYMADSLGGVWLVRGRPEAGESFTREPPVPWRAEFADMTHSMYSGRQSIPNTKELVKLQLRFEAEPGASCAVFLRYDSVGQYEKVRELAPVSVKRSHYIAVTPRRSDHFRIMLEGRGTVRVYALSRQYSVGSENRTYYGKN